jgi:hypothetical protein
MDSLKDHDAKLGLPVTWGDSLKRKQVVEQDLINARREVELDAAREDLAAKRGQRVDRVEMTKAIAQIRDSWWRNAQMVSGEVLMALPGLPMEARALVKQTVEAAVAAAAERVKKELA